jgi:uncharacterized metal-binding protein YceD (DUF177 family)
VTEPEFTRRVDVRQCDGQHVVMAADETERAALAKRFDLVRIDRVEASLTLSRKDHSVSAIGSMQADFVQSCAVSAEDLPVSIEEELSFQFVPERSDYDPDEEVEIDAQGCDEIDYSGAAFDLGEAVAQSLALAIDPFLSGPGAEEARRKVGMLDPEETGPFAALKGLKLKD